MTKQNSLYSLMAQAAQKEVILFENEGDLDSPEVQEILAVTDVHIPAKVDGYKFQIDHFRAVAEQLANQEKLISAMKKRMTSAADRLEENLLDVMEKNGVEYLDGNQCEMRIKLNPFSVEIVDEAQLPETAFRIEKKLSLSQIRTLFKEGPVPGARLMRTKKIEIRPATRKVGE